MRTVLCETPARDQPCSPGLLGSLPMPGPRTNAAFYAAPVEEFLTASEEEVYAPLASPHGYTLAALKSWGAVQQSA